MAEVAPPLVVLALELESQGLFEAANVLLVRHPKPSKLRTWGLGLAARIGMRRAKVAVARKLAVIMHRVWKDDRDFDWGDTVAAA